MKNMNQISCGAFSLSRRDFLQLVPMVAAGCVAAPAPRGPKKIAAIVSTYYQNSHADVIVSRLLETQTLDGKGERLDLVLSSLYTDQVPKTDKSRTLATTHGFKIYKTVEEALTLGTGRLAVDGVLLVAEHGDYPVSDTGQVIYPKRRLFEEVQRVFRKTGRAVPVFIDKHIADNWTDAKWIYDTAKELGAPLMAGSSLPTLWRRPIADVPRGARLEEMLAVSYHTLDAYGFHALEMMQCLAERRVGGETGIRQVQCLENDAVWAAGERGVYSDELMKEAFTRLERPPKGDWKAQVKNPVLWVIDYDDGFRARVLTLNNVVGEWAVAWRERGVTKPVSTCFWTQEARPFMHFAHLLEGVNQMFQTGKPAWPAERTLMTSGLLDALLQSKKQGGKILATNHLRFAYRTDWNWRQPPEPPKGRPMDGQ